MKQFLLTVFLCSVIATANAQQQVRLYGTIKNCSKDTIRCVLQENSVIRKSRTYYIPVVNGDFKISIPVNQPAYLYIQEENNWAGGMVSPGEDIGILYDSKNLNSTLAFSGSAKDKCIWAMEYTGARLARQMDPQTKIAKEKPDPVEHLFHYFDSAQDYHLGKLKQIKNIDSVTFNILKGHVEGSAQYYKYATLTRVYGETASKILATRKQQLSTATVDAIEKLLTFNESYYNSPVYCEQVHNVLYMELMDMIMTKRIGERLQHKYAYLDSLLPGRLKVPFMTMVLEDDINNNKPIEEIQSMIDFVYAFPATPDYKEYILSQLARKVYFKKGMKAPDFVVENEKGQKLNLSSFKGKVVYMDFWFATCGPCHGLFSMIKPVKEHFKNNKDVVFLTISVDDKEQWKKALKTFTIGGLHAYTENKERHHTILKDYKVQEYPTTFLIDKNGQIFLAHPSGAPDVLQKQIEEALKL